MEKLFVMIYQHDINCLYILLEDKILYRQQIPDFEFLEKGVDKLLRVYQNNSEQDSDSCSRNVSSKENKIFPSNSLRELKDLKAYRNNSLNKKLCNILNN